MQSIELERDFLIKVVENIGTIVEKSKNVDTKLSKIETILLGDELHQRLGLLENFRTLSNDVKVILELINSEIEPELVTLKLKISEDVKTIENKIFIIEDRLLKVEDWVSSIKTLPAKLLLLIPSISLIVQIIASLLIPYFFPNS